MGKSAEIFAAVAQRRGARKALVAAAFVVALANSGHAQDVPTDPAAFTEAVARLYREGPQGVEARIDGPLELTIRLAGHEEKIYLNTAFSLCLRDHTACPGFLVRQTEAMRVAVKPHRTPVAAEVRITVRPSAYLNNFLAAKRADQPVVAEPLVDDLWMLGVRDQPTTIEMLGPNDLDALKLSPDQALALGKHNLEGAARRVIADAVEGSAVGVRAFRGTDYTASLIVFPELWEPLAEKFDGQLLVAAPASDAVLFADGRRPTSRAEMLLAVAQTAARAKRPISPAVFEWTPTGWNKIDAVQGWPP
jgi:hypothetical protein